MVGITLTDVALSFRVRKRGRTTLKQLLVDPVFRPSANPFMVIEALKNINLRIGEGERLGLIGHNGAGKSTLLRLLAGIYPPTSGTVEVEGKINSLLDIGVGIEGDASGWDNILYRGLLQGDLPSQVEEKKHQIADFSELGDALDMPVRFYSSGMKVRLLFSIATAIEPEILLLDEVLSAGDVAFQEKAFRRMTELIDKARLIVFASHDLGTLCRLCTKVLWLDHGAIRMAGEPRRVIETYETFMRGAQAAQLAA
jgi:ABC-type polysaccharide/polyol phosphate transport system ATPase subunit